MTAYDMAINIFTWSALFPNSQFTLVCIRHGVCHYCRCRTDSLCLEEQARFTIIRHVYGAQPKKPLSPNDGYQRRNAHDLSWTKVSYRQVSH